MAGEKRACREQEHGKLEWGKWICLGGKAARDASHDDKKDDAHAAQCKQVPPRPGRRIELPQHHH